MVIQILCSISLPKSSCACLEYNPPTNTNMYILGAQALVTMGTKQNCLHTQITQTLIPRLKKWDFELCKFQFKGGILLGIDVSVISPCLANKWFIKNGTAVSSLHTYYWVWRRPKLRLTMLEKLLGGACVHRTGKQCTERQGFSISTAFSAYLSSSALFWSHVISKHHHGRLWSEVSVFSGEGNVAEAFSAQTGGGTRQWEHWCAVRLPRGWHCVPRWHPALSPASFPDKMCATESYRRREQMDYFKISGGEITLYFAGQLLPSEKLPRYIYRMISSTYLALFRKENWKI